ncbi:MAG: hypothetical protein JRJ38_13430 [Deltaproteobacteria bacterium]|nr:hypothetical protein [Deltaproteobacteria bacterium]
MQDGAREIDDILLCGFVKSFLEAAFFFANVNRRKYVEMLHLVPGKISFEVAPSFIGFLINLFLSLLSMCFVSSCL